MKKDFPTDFLWGAGTAAYQVEGAVSIDGKGMSIMERTINPEFCDLEVASDHYHRLAEDVALMKEMGLKAYRFSISWTRLLPTGRGEVNQKGVAFYHRLLDLLIQNEIEPIVTIYHFDLPVTLQDEYGGWNSRKIIKDYEAYCRLLFTEYGEKVKYWSTINEQSNMFLLSYLMEFDDSLPLLKQKYQMNHIMTLAHAAAITLCHQLLPDALIGPAIGITPNYPLSSKPADVEAARLADDFRTYFFTDLYCYGTYRPNIWRLLEERQVAPDILPGDMALIQRAKPDYLGINYYNSRVVRAFDPQVDNLVAEDELVSGLYVEVENHYVEKTRWGWEIDPLGLRKVLLDVHERYGLPIIVTENGIGEVEELVAGEITDDYRISYLHDHLEQCYEAIQDGVNLLGFCPWSFLDLVSTSSGFRKRYGFVFVNRTDQDLKDLNRYRKKSFYWYQKVIANNALVAETL